MRYRVLAADYDGTLAHDGRVDDRTADAIARLRASGRRAVLVTGRILADLRRAFPRVDELDLVVAENGATVWRPGGEERALAPAPPRPFLAALHARGVRFDAGRVVVGTRDEHEADVVEAIHALGLDLQLVFNKGAVMVLPPGVTKASGLAAAVDALGLTEHEVVAIGDAENDVVMLTASECGVAVDNALPAVKHAADLVTDGARGAGVVELVEALLEDDLAGVDPPRRRVELGVAPDGPVAVSPARTRVLVADGARGPAAALAASFAGRLAERGYQLCLVDSGGAFAGVPGVPRLGSERRAPELDEVVAALGAARTSVAVALGALSPADRAGFVARLVPRLAALRARAGRPHWLALDDADRALGSALDGLDGADPLDGSALLLVAGDAHRLAPSVLRALDVVVAADAEDHVSVARPGDARLA